jgi:hypothetical protein
MFVRSLRAGLPAVLLLASVAQAQDAPPRHTSTATFGKTTVTVEHGQPPWSEDRLGQIANIPPGQPWRMGSELLTTIEIKGGPIFFGDKLITPARYGFNLVRTGEKDWMFVTFEPLHESPQGPYQMVGDEPSSLIPTRFAADAEPSVAALTIDVTGGEAAGKCELSWGPMRVSAPITPITVTTAPVTINSNEAEASWYARPLQSDTDLTKPMIAGKIALDLDGDDCSMNVYVMMQGEEIVALFRNAEREKWETENSQIDGRQKQLEAAIQQFGAQAEAQLSPIISDLKHRQAVNEVYLEDSVDRPDNLKFSEKALEGKGTGLRCDLLKVRGGLRIEVTLGAKTAVVAVDEEQFVKKASG